MNGSRLVRAVLASLLLIALIPSCGLPLFFTGTPRARLNPPPGSYDAAVYVEPDWNGNESFRWTLTEGANISEFERFDGVHVSGALTFWYFSIDPSGLRSPIKEARYEISDGEAPVIANDEGFGWWARGYYSMDIGWPRRRGSDTSGGPDIPSDDNTPWEELEFAVFSSRTSRLETIEEAEAALATGTAQMDLFWTTNSDFTRVSFDRPGAGKNVNVFVRDRSGNATPYGSRFLRSSPALSVYAGAAAAGDELYLNQLSGGSDPAFAAGDPVALPGNTTLATAMGRIADDGDLRDDLAVVYSDGSNDFYRWYPTTAAGTIDLGSAVTLLTDGPSAVPRTIRIADMTQDGIAEILATTASLELRVFDSQTASAIIVVSGPADQFDVGDLDGDGYPDVVGVDSATGTVTVWRNIGGTALQLVAQSWTAALPGTVDGATIADVNRDGYADLLLTDPANVPNIRIYHGGPGAVLTEDTQTSAYFPANMGTTSVAVADFDRDGWLDLFVGNNAIAHSEIYVNDATGGFFFTATADLPSVEDSRQTIAADMNGDGWPDVVEVFNLYPPVIWINNVREWWNGAPDFILQSSATIGTNSTTTVAVGQVR